MSRLGLAAVGASIAAGLLALEGIAEARPGGGHSYSGGSSGGGGGDGGGGGALVHLLIRLIIYKPQIGLPIAAVVGVGYYLAKRKNNGLSDWDSGESIASVEPSADLDNIRAHDPDFSMVTFSDFVYALYAAAHRARTTPAELEKLGPYLSPAACSHLQDRLPPSVPVQTVVVGSMRVLRASIPLTPQQGPIQVMVRFESNITVGNETATQNHYTHENWSLVRSATARSRPPGQTRSFPCPNCGAPFEATDTAACSYCGENVGGGQFDWGVAAITLVHEEPRPPKLTGHANERGTQLQTVYHPQFQEKLAELQAADATVGHESLFARVKVIFFELNKSWSGLDLAPARPFISDGMADYLGYWVDAYRSQSLRNITAEPRIVKWDVCRVTRDRYYDSIVIRIFAESLDYTIEEPSGKVVGGSKKKPRAYSEYWTLIRGSQTRGHGADPKACPNCGAGLAISMGGNCEFCGVHVTAGEFDWVLSKIEQDEAYTG